jgi:alkylhydroperoxidase/carboxymuconolactone decarboxylase family protein YurZ
MLKPKDVRKYIKVMVSAIRNPFLTVVNNSVGKSVCGGPTAQKKMLSSLKKERRARLVSFLSAAIAKGNNNLAKTVMESLSELRIGQRLIYETVLQSYLFLGFPRMIEAGLVYNEVFGDAGAGKEKLKKYSSEETLDWFNKGRCLCRKVYGKNYDLLERRFMMVSPEIFRWMVLEGYGKVLSRPGMTQIERELAEVAALIVDKRERQLLSHVIGSLNVGASVQLIRKVNEDIRPLSGMRAFKMAEKIISKIEKKHEIEK